MSTVEGHFSTGTVIRESFHIFSRNIVPFGLMSILLVALPRVVMMQTSLARYTRFPGGFGAYSMQWHVGGPGVMGFVSVALSFILYGALVYGTFRDLSGGRASIEDNLRHGLSRALPVLGVSLIVGIAFFIGFMLFMVPGLIVACIFAVAVPVAVVEAPGVFASMERSAALTRGYRWPIFGLAVIYGISFIVVGSLLGVVLIALLFTAPIVSVVIDAVVNALMTAFAAVSFTVLYAELRRLKDGVDATEIAKVFD